MIVLWSQICLYLGQNERKGKKVVGQAWFLISNTADTVHRRPFGTF